MGQAASSRVWRHPQADMEGKGSDHHRKYKDCIIALGVTLGVVFSALIAATVWAAFQHRSFRGEASFVVPSLGNVERRHYGVSVVPDCLDGWIGYRGKCYYFSEEEMNWNSSQHFCSSFNASLAAIDTQQEKDFMMRYAGITEHWIGLKRESKQPWKWVNGTQFSHQLFQVKAEGDCAYLSDVFVSSSRCYSQRNWICSKLDGYTNRKENTMERLDKFYCEGDLSNESQVLFEDERKKQGTFGLLLDTLM